MNDNLQSNFSEFEKIIRNLRPSADSLPSEVVFYRAGWEAARSQLAVRRVSLIRSPTFGWGLASGVAASVVGMMFVQIFLYSMHDRGMDQQVEGSDRIANVQPVEPLLPDKISERKPGSDSLSMPLDTDIAARHALSPYATLVALSLDRYFTDYRLPVGALNRQSKRVDFLADAYDEQRFLDSAISDFNPSESESVIQSEDLDPGSSLFYAFPSFKQLKKEGLL